MDLSQETRNYLKLLHWLRRCGHPWTHFCLRSLVLQAKDGPRALWTDVVLADSNAVPYSSVDALARARDIRIVNAVGTYADLPRLMRSLRAGLLPAWATGESVAIQLAWKRDTVPQIRPFSITPSPEQFGIKFPKQDGRWWFPFPHGLLALDVGSLQDWHAGREDRYQWLNGLDDQARRAGYANLMDLGRRAGLLGEVSIGNSSSNAIPVLQIVAPHLVRIARASLDRQSAALTVEITRSSRLAERAVEVTLSEADRPLRPAISLPSGTSTIAVFENVHAGHAELRLHDDVFDSFSLRQGVLREPYRRSARAAVGNIMEGGLDPLKDDLLAAEGVAIEPAFRRLLYLLGWSSTGLSRNATQPADLPDGVMRFDVLAFGRRDSILLAAECSSNWFGDEKLAKLVTRARELQLALQERLAPSDVPHVQPVLVVTRRRAVAAPHLLEAARNHAVGVIAQEDLTDLIDYLAAEEPPAKLAERFSACFPENSWLAPPGLIQEIGNYELW